MLALRAVQPLPQPAMSVLESYKPLHQSFTTATRCPWWWWFGGPSRSKCQQLVWFRQECDRVRPASLCTGTASLKSTRVTTKIFQFQVLKEYNMEGENFKTVYRSTNPNIEVRGLVYHGDHKLSTLIGHSTHLWLADKSQTNLWAWHGLYEIKIHFILNIYR